MSYREEKPMAGLKDTDVVYVTQTGSKFHLYSDCSYLNRATAIIGTVCKEALDSGRELCSRCESRREKEAAN